MAPDDLAEPRLADEPTEIVGSTGEVFTVLSVLGRGGMSAVYKAQQISMNRVVALKLMSSGLFDKTSNQRFIREARTIGKLDHPNIIKIYGVSLTETQVPFLILEYVDGQSLSTRIKDPAPISIEEFNTIFNGVLSALAAAHQQGIVHRDLTPSNVLIGKDGTVKVADFGIARVFDSTTDHSQKLTKTGHIVGTPTYMSPEQCGEEEVDGRADLYSAACLMYEVLTGQSLFSGENPLEIMYKKTFTKMPHIDPDAIKGTFGHRLIPFLQKGLERLPANRFQTAEEMLVQLNACMAVETGPIPTQGEPGRKTSKMPRVTKKLKLQSAIVLAGIFLIALIWLWYSFESSRPKPNKIARQALTMNPEKLLRKAYERWPEYTVSQDRKTVARSIKNELDTALEIAKYRENAAQITHAYMEIARFHIITDNHKAARAAIGKALEQFPKAYATNTNKNAILTVVLAAEFSRQLGDLKRAHDLNKQALTNTNWLAKHGPSVDAQELKAQIMQQEALLSYTAGDYDDAVTKAEAVLRYCDLLQVGGGFPARLHSHEVLAHSYLRQGKTGQALDSYRQINKYQPKDIDDDRDLKGVATRGEMLCHQVLGHQKEEALAFQQCVDEVKQRFPQNSDGAVAALENQQATYLFNIGDRNGAVKMEEQAILHAKLHLPPDNNCAALVDELKTALSRGEIEEAARALQQSVDRIKEVTKSNPIQFPNKEPEVWWKVKTD